MTRLFFLMLICTTGWMAHAQTADERLVEEAARQVLEAISNRDTTEFRAAMISEGRLIGIGQRDGVPSYGVSTVDDSIRMLSSEGPDFLERMWDPEIRIDGPLASVWTRYDFYINGNFSHCGTDAFFLVRTAEGWKVTTVTYTAERDPEKCPESPLGPPQH